MSESQATVGAPEHSALAEYLVVLRARSAARFEYDEGFEFKIGSFPELDLHNVRIRAFTRWVRDGPSSLPRELIVEVRGSAVSLDEAVSKFSVAARPVAVAAGFVANVRVGALEVHVAYDCSADRGEREFLETFLPDEQGAVTEGRIIRPDLCVPLCLALFNAGSRAGRLSRAMLQYELALREWYVGGEWQALSHLYMAVETLTDLSLDRELARQEVTAQELATSAGIEISDPERPNWRNELKTWIRREVIFSGDAETYRSARKASDGIEHGFLEIDEIIKHALKVTDQTFTYVRREILELLDVDADIVEQIMEIHPRDVQSRRKVARGRLIGYAEDLAAPGELYPLLEWRSGIEAIDRDGRDFRVREKEHFTVRTHPAVGFQLQRLEIHGRLENGAVPVELTDTDVRIESTPGPSAAGLLSSVMPIVDEALASGATTPKPFPQMIAFNLFSQGVAFFQSAQTLIIGFQPVEALPSLLGLTTIAGRFEQILTPGGPGLGIAVRLALDSIENDSEGRQIDRRGSDLLASSSAANVEVPPYVDGVEGTAVWTSLAGEMRLARDVIEVRYGIVGKHLKKIDDEHLEFHTRLEPDSYADLIASACVIAQLDLLRGAAILFELDIDTALVTELAAKAFKLNAASAAILGKASP